MIHPRTDFAASLRPLPGPGSAAGLGYRMPAEWEPIDAVWLCPPHNPMTWPGCLEKAQAQFAGFMDALRQFVTVRTTRQIHAPTIDSWVRDYGPIFVKDDKGHLAAHDFHFNTWGGKYGQRPADDQLPQHIARAVGVPLWIHDMVLEGGSIDVNGQGTVMTTEQCLLNPNRNPRMTREEIIRHIHDALGTRHVVWLPGGIVGDDTDGHIDDIARFVAPGSIVAVRAEADHPDHAMLEKNWVALRAARDQDGKELELIELPMPEPIFYDFPTNLFVPAGRRPVPASYANFLIANGLVAVPIFGQESDDAALRVLEKAFPKHKIVGLPADALIIGLGAFHCLSQQQPKA